MDCFFINVNFYGEVGKMRDILYTYIVPSKIRSNGFEEHIYNICSNHYIDRVVIINSDGRDYRPTETGKILYKHRDKILVVNSTRGVDFINQGWNVGICYAKQSSSYFILANEFLKFDADVISLVSLQIEDLSNLGVLGIDNEIITENDFEDINYIYTHEAFECNDKFGTLMFIPRKRFIQINGVKCIYGDKFIFKSLKEKGCSNYVLRSDTFRIKDNSPALSNEDRLQIALDKKFWGEISVNSNKLIL